MAALINKMPCLFVFILLLTVVTPISSHTQEENHKRLDRAATTMREKGCEDMANLLVSFQDVLFPDLEILELENKTYTVFAPGTPSFWARSNDDPPLSLIQYHVVPIKVDRDLLMSPSMYEHKLDTLLQGHPLVVTTARPDAWAPLASLNLVPVLEWNIYNDGHLIVHGLPMFFSPDYQTSQYPLFNGPEAPAVSPTAAEIFSRSSSSIGGHGVFSVALPVVVGLLYCFSFTCLLFEKFI